MTSVIIALAVEMLARRLTAQGAKVPTGRAARVLTTMVELPASLRWSYRLERRSYGLDYAQRINLERSGGKGYVPIGITSDRATRSMRTRAQLVESMELTQPAAEKVDGTGFLIDAKRGKAFLPLGVTKDELESIPRVDLKAAVTELKVPHEVDPILVVRHRSELFYRSANTGEVVDPK